MMTDFEMMVIEEMVNEGWHYTMTKEEMKQFYKEWWSKRLG